MARLLDLLCAAPSEQKLFLGQGRTATAGQVRAAAQTLADHLRAEPGDIILETASLARFTSGLLAAGLLGRRVLLPAHGGAAYLTEIGGGHALVSDGDAGFAFPDLFETRTVEPFSDASPDPALPLTFFTSGSTGEPKPVAKSIAQLDSEAALLSRVWPLPPGTDIVSTVPHQHIYGLLFRLFWPLHQGCVAHDQPQAYWEHAAADIRPGETVLVTSPAHLSRIPDHITGAPMMITSSGAPLPADAAQDAASKLGTWPVEVLGSTETGGVAWRNQQDGNSLWRPLPDVEIHLSETSELQVTSPHADGDGLIAMGDIGEITDDGRLRMKGRVGPVVKVEGVRVSLVRVEQALGDLKEVQAARTLTLQHRRGQLAAVLVLSEHGRQRLAKDGAFRLGRYLRQQLGHLLSVAERPKHWRFVAEMPVNAQSKTTMADLAALFDPAPYFLDLTDIADQGDIATARLTVTEDLPWFEGHFPGQPILAGMAQVHMAMLAAQQIWRWQPEGSNLMKLKFKQVVQPGDVLSLNLRRDRQSALMWFEFACGDAITSSGRIGGQDG